MFAGDGCQKQRVFERKHAALYFAILDTHESRVTSAHNGN